MVFGPYDISFPIGKGLEGDLFGRVSCIYLSERGYFCTYFHAINCAEKSYLYSPFDQLV
jgi:hypothetical protein